MKLKELVAWTVGAIVLMSGAIPAACAQTTAVAKTSAALQHWNSAGEISFTGTIRAVVTESVPGTPVGVSLVMDGSPSFESANLGSQLNSTIKSELTAGQSVTLKGIVRSFSGQNILLIRQLTIDQQTTQVRSAQGIVTPLVEAGAAQGNRPRGKNAIAGGAQ